MDCLIEKNILDIKFQKYLTITATTTGIIFAYFIAVAIGFVSKQITLSTFSIIFLLITTSTILFPGVFILKKAVKKLQEIPDLMRELK